MRQRPRARLRRNGRQDRERTGLHFIPPGQPWRNVESFNNMFWSLAQARVVISDWKEDYVHRRRHTALGDKAPAVYAAARTHR